ncbi:MAG: hypothetical protein A2Y62_21065 [Candidatus Fischerbacteria bacterium RBG_13_37_8]|uniref:Uncharacterized protein n=1 Tax=Candidatus Fischerbacteria bacterium RBG_13_37_8 TaxID=1817863 RepID=A0A1F5V7T6_9BACT|nr:MAG: hypothetical protein A2Y62_21065 [Candidatus Fischerbacteria bacterium RBG_13_37_8]
MQMLLNCSLNKTIVQRAGDKWGLKIRDYRDECFAFGSIITDIINVIMLLLSFEWYMMKMKYS